MHNSRTRRETPPIKVWVDPEEKQAIKEHAVECNMSMSAYCRMLGLGCQPQSRMDNVKIDELLKVNGDLGRLGGELKLLMLKLSEDDKPVFRRRIDETLTEIYSTQHTIKTLVTSYMGIA